MDIDKSYLARFQVGKNSTEERELCAEIYEASGKTLSYGMLISMCRRNGVQCVRECWIEANKANADDPIRLFMWMMKKNGTVWRE